MRGIKDTHMPLASAFKRRNNFIKEPVFFNISEMMMLLVQFRGWSSRKSSFNESNAPAAPFLPNYSRIKEVTDDLFDVQCLLNNFSLYDQS